MSWSHIEVIQEVYVYVYPVNFDLHVVVKEPIVSRSVFSGK